MPFPTAIWWVTSFSLGVETCSRRLAACRCSAVACAVKVVSVEENHTRDLMRLLER